MSTLARAYVVVHVEHGIHVEHVDVAVAQVALRLEVDGEIEEVEAVADVAVDDA